MIRRTHSTPSSKHWLKRRARSEKRTRTGLTSGGSCRPTTDSWDVYPSCSHPVQQIWIGTGCIATHRTTCSDGQLREIRPQALPLLMSPPTRTSLFITSTGVRAYSWSTSFLQSFGSLILGLGTSGKAEVVLTRTHWPGLVIPSTLTHQMPYSTHMPSRPRVIRSLQPILAVSQGACLFRPKHHF